MPKKQEPILVQGEVYKIDWLDSGMQVNLGWETVTDHLANWKLNDMRVSSYGIAVYEDEDVVGLGLSVSEVHDHVFGLQLIVKNNIIGLEQLGAE